VGVGMIRLSFIRCSSSLIRGGLLRYLLEKRFVADCCQDYVFDSW
jgi:hypothetical protein